MSLDYTFSLCGCLWRRIVGGVSFNKTSAKQRCMFPETFMARAFFPQGFSVLPYTGILTRIRACEQQPKFCEHEQGAVNFCEQFEHRPKFAGTFTLDRWDNSIPLRNARFSTFLGHPVLFP